MKSDPLRVSFLPVRTDYSDYRYFRSWPETTMYPMWSSPGRPGDRAHPRGCLQTATETNKPLTTMQRAYGQALIKKIKENNHGGINGFMGKD